MNNDKDNTVKKTLLITTFLLAGCVERPQVISDCQGVAEREVLCGWQKPEDMELMPDGRHLVVSQMAAGHGSIAGSLALLDTRDGSKQVWPMAEVAVSDGWGDADCAAPDPSVFAPHGIHLSRHESGTLQLLVVNHGGRESVEFFELRDQDGVIKPLWRGCVIPPEGSFLNDIVALPEGGFMATHMYTRGDAPVGTLGWQEITALAGFNPGHIWAWDGERFSKLPGFSGDYPNGIQISADGETLFVNLWAGSTLQKLDRHTGKLLAVRAGDGTTRSCIPTPGQVRLIQDRDLGRGCGCEHRGPIRYARAHHHLCASGDEPRPCGGCRRLDQVQAQTVGAGSGRLAGSVVDR